MHIFQRFFRIHWHMKELNYYLWRILSLASPLLFRVNIFAAFSQHILLPWLVCVFSFVYHLRSGLNPTSCNFLLWLQLTCSDWSRIQELRYLLILWNYQPYDFLSNILSTDWVMCRISYTVDEILSWDLAATCRCLFFISLDVIFWKEKLVQDSLNTGTMDR
jgi:hypothetical protein